ncbi:pentatricopeptide repeat-containing protein At3g50420-like [Papaver somniferum]|uniref:pentatricopeptide repeat-containing protein At3g50420-like n=1 Tax=Papaver somniferum TaxID=3469 RepID=UPI000E7021B9|nr:pentatricopeptide repeat-containing protein At3g50420-like [Papaver somniferum]
MLLYEALIKKCVSITSIRKARQLHALLLTSMSMTISLYTPFFHNNLISMYSKCGSLRDSQLVFDGMPQRNIISFNALITAYSGSPNEALFAFRVLSEMRTLGFRPNNSTFTSLLGACYALEDQLVGSKVHCQVLKFGFVEDVRVQTSLLGMYSHCGNLESAAKVFGGMADRDSIAWNSMIFACMKNDNLKEGVQMFCKMVGTGSKPTLFTYSMLLNGCGKLGDHVSGKIIHAQVIVCDLSADVPLENALLDMYCKCGYMETALCLFKYMEKPDMVSWNSMISGYSENGDGNMAVSLFIQLCRISYRKPNEYTLAAVISGTGDLPASYYGKPLHAQVQKLGFESSVFVGSTLIYMYFKNEEARSALSEPDLRCWNSMLGGFSNHGKADEAIKLFNEVLKQGLKPDKVTFVSLLSACSHCGMVEEGNMYWNYMKRNGMKHGFKHYSCMVSLLCRAGLFSEAEVLIKEANFGERNTTLWRILLSSCIVYRNFKLGVTAADEVLKLNVEDDATLILLSNLYAAAGRWDRVAEMRRKIRRMMSEKDPGVSWIQISHKIHDFASGDQSHQQADDARNELHRIPENMKKCETSSL